MKMRAAVLLCVATLFSAGLAEAKLKREPVTLTLPEGQTMTFIGEPEDRSDWVERGRAMGHFKRAPFFALQQVHDLRLSGHLVLVAGVDVHKSTLMWPAGRWVEFTLSDGSILQPKRIFTSGPMNEMQVLALGPQSQQVPGDELHVARPPGMKTSASPIYFALPASVERNGRPSRIEWRDISSVRLIQVPPSSLKAVAERR